jgi:acetyl-CoA carboxylase biotin carboxyl carrier protein
LNPGYSYLTSKLGTRSNRPQAGGGAVFWLLLQLVSFGQFHIRLADLPRSKDVEAQPATAAGVAPAVDPAPAPEVVRGEADVVEEGLVPVKTNVTSVFYRLPSPDELPFVEEGDEVEQETVICLLEVMKCFLQVTADTKGCIEKICVESNNLVEEGTVLFLIRPE